MVILTSEPPRQDAELEEPYAVLCSILALQLHRESVRRQGGGDLDLDLDLGKDHLGRGWERGSEGSCDIEEIGSALLSVADEIGTSALPGQLIQGARRIIGDGLVRRPFAAALVGEIAPLCSALQRLDDGTEALGLKHVQLLRHCMRVVAQEEKVSLDLLLSLYERGLRMKKDVEACAMEAVASILEYAGLVSSFDAEITEAIKAIEKGESPKLHQGHMNTPCLTDLHPLPKPCCVFREASCQGEAGVPITRRCGL